MKCHLGLRFQEKSGWSYCFDPEVRENILEVGKMKQLFTLWCPGSRVKMIARGQEQDVHVKDQFPPTQSSQPSGPFIYEQSIDKVSILMFPLLLNSTNTNSKQAFYTQHLGPFLSPNNNVRLNIFNPHLIFKTTCSLIATFINVHLVSKWLNGFPQTTLEGNAGLSFSFIFWLLRLRSYPQHSSLQDHFFNVSTEAHSKGNFRTFLLHVISSPEDIYC